MAIYKNLIVRTAEEMLEMDFDELDSILNDITNFNNKIIERISDRFYSFQSHKEIYQLKNDLKNINSRIEIIRRIES